MKGKKFSKINKHIMKYVKKIKEKRGKYKKENKYKIKTAKQYIRKKELGWFDKPKSKRKDNQKEINYGSGYRGGKSKSFCTKCRFVSNSGFDICPSCKSNKTVRLNSVVRVPKKKANKTKWKNFWKNFVEPALNRQKE